MTFDQTGPSTELDTDAQAELLFYHTYVDHYSIAEHYVARDLGREDLEEFSFHLDGCQECADRVLLAEMFRDQRPKRRGTVEQAIAESVRKMVEEAHLSAPDPVEHRAAKLPTRAADRPARKLVLSALAHSKKLGAVPPSLPTQIRAELKAQPLVQVSPEVVVLPEVVKEPAARAPEIVTQPPTKTLPNKPAPPLPANVFLCTYDADRRGCRIPERTGSGISACPLPQRARWVASFSPLQLMLLGGAAALLLIAIPCGLFVLELSRLPRN